MRFVERKLILNKSQEVNSEFNDAILLLGVSFHPLKYTKCRDAQHDFDAPQSFHLSTSVQ